MITGIDHIALTVYDLEQAVADYSAILGRTPNWRGQMGNVHHAWFQLGNAGIDLIAPRDGTPSQVSARLEKHGEGVWAIGFSVPDIAAAQKLYSRRGLPFAAPGETVTENAHGIRRRWKDAHVPSRATHGVHTFLVEKPAEKWPLSPATCVEAEAVAELDHVVVNTPNPERAVAHYGGRLGLDLRLDRSNEQWGARQLFFRCGTALVEVGASLKAPVSDGPDRIGGLAFRVRDGVAIQARIARAGVNVSEVRKGRKPGTEVFTVRDRTHGVPTLMLAGNAVE